MTKPSVAPAAIPASTYSFMPTEQPRGSGSDGSSSDSSPHIRSISARSSSEDQWKVSSQRTRASVVKRTAPDHARPCGFIAAIWKAYCTPWRRPSSTTASCPIPTKSGYHSTGSMSFICHLIA